MQTFGMSTETRDLKDEFVDFWREAVANDGVICQSEVAQIAPLLAVMDQKIDQQDDAVRLVVAVMKVGQTKRVVRLKREYESLHEPIIVQESIQQERPYGSNHTSVTETTVQAIS